MVSNGKLLSASQLVNPSTIYTTVECVLEGKEKQHSSAPGRKWGGLWKTQGRVQGSQTPSRVPGTQMTHSLNPTNLFPIFWTRSHWKPARDATLELKDLPLIATHLSGCPDPSVSGFLGIAFNAVTWSRSCRSP